jgi:hypothetical protein
MIMVGPPDAEASRLIEQHELGAVVKPGQPNSPDLISSAILKFADQSELVQKMGIRARQLWEADYTGADQMQRWEEMIRSHTRHSN